LLGIILIFLHLLLGCGWLLCRVSKFMDKFCRNLPTPYATTEGTNKDIRWITLYRKRDLICFFPLPFFRIMNRYVRIINQLLERAIASPMLKYAVAVFVFGSYATNYVEGSV
jgi:hypothetical protein